MECSSRGSMSTWWVSWGSEVLFIGMVVGFLKFPGASDMKDLVVTSLIAREICREKVGHGRGPVSSRVIPGGILSTLRSMVQSNTAL